MKKVFLDSFVLVAACASKAGASALILGLCRTKKVKGYVSVDVINEARKNIYLKFTNLEKKRLLYYIRHAKLLLSPTPSIEKVVKCEQVIYPKDASILAAAKESSADFLITLNRKHFLKKDVAKFIKPTKILLPGDFVRNFTH